MYEYIENNLGPYVGIGSLYVISGMRIRIPWTQMDVGDSIRDIT